MARWSQGGAGGGTSGLVVPSWALQESIESRDPSLGWGVGNGSSQLSPRQGTWASGCQGEVLGLQQPPFLLPSGKTPVVLAPGPEQGLQSGWFGTSPGCVVGAASSLTCTVAKGKCLEPDLGLSAASRTRAAHTREGNKPQPTLPACTAAQAGLGGKSCLCLQHLLGAWEGLALPDV